MSKVIGVSLIIILVCIVILSLRSDKVTQEEFKATLGEPIGMTKVPFCPTPTGECAVFEK